MKKYMDLRSYWPSEDGDPILSERYFTKTGRLRTLFGARSHRRYNRSETCQNQIEVSAHLLIHSSESSGFQAHVEPHPRSRDRRSFIKTRARSSPGCRTSGAPILMMG